MPLEQSSWQRPPPHLQLILQVSVLQADRLPESHSSTSAYCPLAAANLITTRGHVPLYPTPSLKFWS